MSEEKNEYEQQALDIHLSSTSYKVDWANSLFDKLDHINDTRFLSDSVIFYHIRTWINLLRKKTYWEVKRLIASVKLQEKTEKNARKLSVLETLTVGKIFNLRSAAKDYSSLSEFVAVLIHLFGKKFACMILTLHQLEGLDESYLSEYYESDEDEDFRDDFYQDFPFFEPWKWRETQSTRYLTDKNNALRQMLEDLKEIVGCYEWDMHILEHKMLELEEQQKIKLEMSAIQISSLENQM